ncbi:MAG: hypothetical protein QM762_14930 [Chryseolinea sp.]
MHSRLRNVIRAYSGFTKYSINQNIEFNQVQWPLSWANDAKGTSITLNPDITASYRVWNNAFLSISAGYAFDSGGDITISSPWVSRKEEFDWSGARVGLSAFIQILKRKFVN